MGSSSSKLLFTCGSAAIVCTGAWLIRTPLVGWSRVQIARQQQARLVALPDKAAICWLDQLASEDGAGLEPIAAAWADPRPAVAAAAELETLRLVQRWSQLPAAESAPLIARLAQLLARHAPQMSEFQRQAAAVLAQQLLEWPLADAPVDAAAFIADCDTLLRLPPVLPGELRIAALPPAEPQPSREPPLAVQSAEPPPAITLPPALQPVPAPIAVGSPAPLPEPKKLPPPRAKAITISDD